MEGPEDVLIKRTLEFDLQGLEGFAGGSKEKKSRPRGERFLGRALRRPWVLGMAERLL